MGDLVSLVIFKNWIQSDVFISTSTYFLLTVLWNVSGQARRSVFAEFK